jgi:hypothetical protein
LLALHGQILVSQPVPSLNQPSIRHAITRGNSLRSRGVQGQHLANSLLSSSSPASCFHPTPSPKRTRQTNESFLSEQPFGHHASPTKRTVQRKVRQTRILHDCQQSLVLVSLTLDSAIKLLLSSRHFQSYSSRYTLPDRLWTSYLPSEAYMA